MSQVVKRHRRRKLIVAALASTLALVGCATGGDGGADAEVVFVDAIPVNPAMFNPQVIQAEQASSTMYEPLVGIDENYEPVPVLAERWEVSDDALVITFHLREGVTWHDGEPFTSADVKFNIEEVFPVAPNAGLLVQAVDSVETPDDLTVIVNLKEPFLAWLNGQTSQEMLPKHIFEGTEIGTNPANTAPIGTGPFKFDSFSPGENIQVVKNEEYWGESGDVDRIIFAIMPDANARLLALQSGDIDRLAGVPLGEIEVIEDNQEMILNSLGTTRSQQVIFFNTRVAPLDDAEVRKALYGTIDRQQIAEDAYYGYAEAAPGFIPEQIGWARDDSVNFAELIPNDAEANRAVLAAAGLEELTIKTLAGYPGLFAAAELIKSNLAEVGVEVSIIAEDLQVFVDSVYNQNDFEIVVFQGGLYEDPSLGLVRQFTCNPDNLTFVNPTGHCDEPLDSILAEAATGLTPEERRDAFTQAQLRLAETVHAMPLVFDQPVTAYRGDRWEGLDGFLTRIPNNWAAITSAN